MNKKDPKILIIVEGAKTDLHLMHKLLDLYGIRKSHQIVSYNTGIYDLYQKLFFEDDPESLDLLQVLKEHEKDQDKRNLFDEHYTDIILIFDLDPQSPQFSPEKIKKMAQYFTESSDNGKLYLNYPMVESFYHMKSIPDPDYFVYTVNFRDLNSSKYKQAVKHICRIPYKRFAESKEECDIIIYMNLQKAGLLINSPNSTNISADSEQISNLIRFTDTAQILESQLNALQQKNILHALCTCIFYIADYNPALIQVSQ